jgi:predicted CXXCH cytochrome family protein
MPIMRAHWAILVLLVSACQPRDEPSAGGSAASEPTYVGGGVCAGCHAGEAASWRGSDHQLAMQPAEPETVLGDFDDAVFEYNDVTTRFFRRGDEYWVNTDGPGGMLRDFRVGYTFGVEPLQQYLLDIGDGRYQALTIAWDTRPGANGGQRWFHLYPNEAIGSDDPLHWTKIRFNWNSGCAECHSTNVRKNYDAETQRYATSWSSINVDCEACHGPGSNHAASPNDAPMALGAVARAWVHTDDSPIARRVPEATGRAEIEVCAQCHSRRSQLSDAWDPGDPLYDAYRPALLDAGLYHADGQILDEVYVYGSFVQSRMYAAGVTCSDCHDPHSGELEAPGNEVCAQCHLPSAFDTAGHDHHPDGADMPGCVDCHMRARNYMVVDPRRDHSFRVPRPDLSAALDAPNACNACHADRTPDWAVDRLVEWFPNGRTGSFHYGQAIQAGRQWSADRADLLTRLIDDTRAPAIARATAVSLLADQLDATALDAVGRSILDNEPIVELAAIDALDNAPAGRRVDLAQRFLTDSPDVLRSAAARVLLPARRLLSERRRADLDAALAVAAAENGFNADRAEGWLNAANLQVQMGDAGAAETSYRRALELEPEFVPAYVNLADLYRQLGAEDEAEQSLRQGLLAAPDAAALHYALGLSLARSSRLDEALTEFARAAELAPDSAQYRYVYGVALNSAGRTDEALEYLADAHERFPGHAPTLLALATMHRDAGDLETAAEFARRLTRLTPADPDARALLRALEAASAQ